MPEAPHQGHMRIYRVVISFMRQGLHFQQERGVKAMTPGQALDDVMSSLSIDQTQISDLKTFVEKPEALDSFNWDTLGMICLNSSQTVRDIWHQRYGA